MFFKYNFYVLKVGHGFICIKVRIISINIIVNVKNFFSNFSGMENFNIIYMDGRQIVLVLTAGFSIP